MKPRLSALALAIVLLAGAWTQTGLATQAVAARPNVGDSAGTQSLRGFLVLKPTEGAALQLKLSYIGTQARPIASMGIATRAFQLGKFKAFHLVYGNDFVVLMKGCRPGGSTVVKALRSAASIKHVKSGAVSKKPVLSFAVVGPIKGKQRGYESELGAGDARSLLSRLRSSLARYPTCSRQLDYLRTAVPAT